MSHDLIYVVLLVVGILLGPCVRHIKNVNVRQMCSSGAGFALVIFALGWQAIHPVVLILVNAFIVLVLNKRTCHILSFSFSFIYLTLIRFGYSMGWPSPSCYGSAIQMYTCLKMIGLSFEIHDKYTHNEDHKEKPNTRLLSIEPSVTDIICYGFCHAGILTGPYYKFQTYWDSLHAPYSKNIQCQPYLRNRLAFVPAYVMIVVLLNRMFSLEHAISEEIMPNPFWYRVLYATVVAYAYRLRLFIGFLLSEGQCIAAGIGAYPKLCQSRPGHGPTLLEHMIIKNGYKERCKHDDSFLDFVTVHGVDVYEVESALITKEVTPKWNMTVQYWLSEYIYRRLPFSPRIYRFSLTMALSAIWHGIEPAYYFCNITFIFIYVTEEITVAVLYKNATAVCKKIIFAIYWPLRQMIHLYLTMTFLLLETTCLFNYYYSVYFYGHVITGIVLIAGLTLNKKQKQS